MPIARFRCSRASLSAFIRAFTGEALRRRIAGNLILKMADENARGSS
jgi:hypothetical protein